MNELQSEVLKTTTKI